MRHRALMLALLPLAVPVFAMASPALDGVPDVPVQAEQARTPPPRSTARSTHRSSSSTRTTTTRTTTTRTTTASRPGPVRATASRPAPVRYGSGPRPTARPSTGPSVVHLRGTAPPVRRPVYGVRMAPPAPVVVQVQEQRVADRSVDRRGSVALGLRSGSYLTGYEGGASYGDFGLGLVGRWRPDEAVGLEVAVAHHNDTWNADAERNQTLAQGSVMLFANPWGRFQPYVLGGLSVNARQLDDAYRGPGGSAERVQDQGALWGPHAGAGLEFAFGQKAALDLELRYVGWMNAGGADPSASGALQTSAGFLVHF